ncbi:PEGA domain-containing protein [Sorangium sp. So ce1000]|uniref:PEGA domain-containing protein n=1 Tax=Sorangium sp. So ce1000 TaxID=3133325 RepID=UPI003F5E4968
MRASRAAALKMLVVPALLSWGIALAQPAPPAGESAEDRKSEAEARFYKGRKLYDERAFSAALAEFQASRALYPGESATIGAAICLKRLHRFDEALDLFEATLRDFSGTMEATTKSVVQRQVVELRGLVGTLDIDGAEPGAAISVDGQSRGEFPLLVPLRVAAGSHSVRVYKEGFEPFEVRIEVAGGQTARVAARLRRLSQTGTLQVTEVRGRELEVVVDDIGIGKTSAAPLSLPLAPGRHVVLLRGNGCLRTAPTNVTVRLNEVARLRLQAEVLKATLRIAPEPVDARVSIDAVELGQGPWEGMVCAGKHTVEVAAEGFLPETRDVSLRRGEREVLSMPLSSDPRSPLWRNLPSLHIVEMSTAALLVPSFGGDVAGTCQQACSSGIGVGGYGVLRGELGRSFGLSFGVSIGALSAMQKISNRSTSLNIVGDPSKPVGSPTARADSKDAGAVADVLQLRGLFLGAWVGYAIDVGLPIHLRLGAGGLFGSVSDARRGKFTASNGGRFGIGTHVQTQPARSVFVTPEVRVGLPLGRYVELNAGLEVPVLFAVSRPRWSDAEAVYAGPDGLGWFDADALVGGVLVTLAPTVGARFRFEL